MKRFIGTLTVIALLAGCGGSEEPSDAVDTGDIALQQISEETDCDKLQRGIDTREGYLAEQEADPEYGMSPEDVESAKQRNVAAQDRMTELDC